MFTKGTNNLNLTYQNKFEVLENGMAVGEIQVILWTYNMFKDYVKNLEKSQFCIRIHGRIDEGDHCKYIRSGSPVICNCRFAGIVDKVENCEQQNPRPCTNVYEAKEWMLYDMKETKPKSIMATQPERPSEMPKNSDGIKCVLSIFLFEFLDVENEGKLSLNMRLEIQLAEIIPVIRSEQKVALRVACTTRKRKQKKGPVARYIEQYLIAR
uniref:Peptidase S1 domain-containing protein n=1 Tax=Glossina palpalis gambiensis TaxID=67801 RepID=A0A1B0BM44_9MUSC